MNGLHTRVCPVRNPRLFGGDHIIKRQFLKEKVGVEAPSFLTGFTQITWTRPGLIHLLSMG
jgi:hypothetical protein